ncbi:MAG TPA: hypothetical protein PK431_17185 [Chitinophagales bacterium]|nr:hypothetical protein [Chitinophagales bacterium]
MPNEVYSTKFNAASTYVQNRYLIAILKSEIKRGNKYVYYNGFQGIKGAVANLNFTDSYDKAVTDCAYDNNVSQEEVMNDYSNWYYVELISEAITSLTNDCNYEQKFF